MDFGFLSDQDTTRFCYLRLRRLKEAIKDPKILDAVAEKLDVPSVGVGVGAGAVAHSKKMPAIERRIDELRGTKTSVWFEVAAPEVLAASIFGAEKLATDGTIQKLFSQARLRADLGKPIAIWLKGSGLTPLAEIPVGAGLIDVVGYRKGGLLSGSKIVGIQVINDLGHLTIWFDQMKALREYTSSMYLACTPALAAEYLTAHAAAPSVNHWDADVLQRRLKEAGIGLLLIEGDAVAQTLLPKEQPPAKAKVGELVALLQARGG